MHPSSLENMQKCYERYLGRSALLNKDRIRVVDIGGANVNGSYADIFSDPRFEYIAVDLAPGEGIDVVLDDPYHLPFADASVDIVISGQAFEHAEFFWKLFEETARLVGRDGFVFLIVPSAGPIHRYPVDCYRFYPDAMHALARYADIPLVEVWHDDRGPWNDLVGVFAHEFAPLDQPASELPTNRYMQTFAPAPMFPKGDGSEVERTAGTVPYTDLLRQIHASLRPRGYLEIGVRRGDSLQLADCPTVAVDPEPALPDEPRANQHLYRVPSDTFFDEYAEQALADIELDLAFVDGMHLFEFALRDFINIERRASGTTVIVIDDIYPGHPLQAERKRQTEVWTGDIWKLHHCLATHRPDLLLLPVDVYPTGMLIVAGLDPSNRTLSERYNPLVGGYRGMTLDGQQDSVLNRQGARAPNDPLVTALLVHLCAERGLGVAAGPNLLRRLLQAFRDSS